MAPKFLFNNVTFFLQLSQMEYIVSNIFQIVVHERGYLQISFTFVSPFLEISLP